LFLGLGLPNVTLLNNHSIGCGISLTSVSNRSENVGLHLESDLQANYDRFVDLVIKSGIVWGLRSEDGDYSSCDSFEKSDSIVLLFWSDEAYARNIGMKYWPDYRTKEINISQFIEDFLPVIKDRGFYIGLNYNSDLAGLEIDPKKLGRDLTKETKDAEK
jgi:hypothetical protein